MSATDGVLTYGYNLGGPDEWLVQEGHSTEGFYLIDWFDEESSEVDFATAALDRLLAVAAGFDGTSSDNGREEALARLGVTVETAGSSTHPVYVLAAHTITAPSGAGKELDFDDLTRTQLAGDWDDKLAAALGALGLTPHQGAAGWLLMSHGDF